MHNTYGYDGSEYCLEASCDYRARYYDFQIGRFLSEDPIGFFGGRNFYNYVANDPVLDVDPSGLSSIRKKGTGNHSYCMDTILGPVCWGNKKNDLMHLALRHKNLGCCVRQFFGNNMSLNMRTLPLIDATHNLHNAAIGTASALDNAGHGRPIVQIDSDSFSYMAYDDHQLVLTYLHETANALAQHQFTAYTLRSRPFLGPRGKYPSAEQRNDPWDPDIGNQFEKCINKK